MKPYIHAELSVNKYGGKISDYIEIHNWFDQTKAHHADMRHRAILHNSWGIFLCEQKFGVAITNSVGKVEQVRDIWEDTVIQDLGRIPSLSDILSLIPLSSIDKLSRPKKEKRVITVSNASTPTTELGIIESFNELLDKKEELKKAIENSEDDVVESSNLFDGLTDGDEKDEDPFSDFDDPGSLEYEDTLLD